jgi:glycosyltransferase involved in cell wall biosynthesis
MPSRTLEVRSGGAFSVPDGEHSGHDTVERIPGRRLVVLIPALNEQDTIGDVVAEIPRQMPGIARVEVIVVDDGSDDMTGQRARAAGVDHVCRHRGNRGLAAAFNRGVTEALARGADIVATLDADGQHDPAALPRLVAPILDGTADLVVGARPLGDPTQGSPARRLGNRMGARVAGRLMGVPLTDVTSGYRAFSREALLQVHVSGGYTYTLETLVQAADKRLRIVEVPSPARARTIGSSRMTGSIVSYVARTGNQAFRTVLHSNPLRVFAGLSAIFAVAAAISTSWFIVSYAAGGMHLPALLASLLLAIAAAALLVCGLLADGICYNRRLLEDALHRIKQLECSEHGDRADRHHVVNGSPGPHR